MKKNIFLLIFTMWVLGLFSCRDLISDNPIDNNIKLNPPSSVTVSFSADTMVTVSWQYQNADKYIFTVEISSDSTSWQKLGDANKENSLTVKYIFEVNKDYFFRVYANIEEQRSSFGSAKAKITLLGSPSELVVTFPVDTKAVLTWKDNSTIESNFEIESSLDGTNYSFAKNVAANTTSTEIEGNYSTNVNYYFRIRAKTTINFSAFSNVAQGKPGLNAPTNLQITFPSDTKARLTWIDNTTYETGFEIEMSSDRTNFTLVKIVNANTTSTEIDAIFLTSITYSFRVRVKTTNNYSGYSNIVEGKPVLNAPSNLIVTFPGDTRARLTWTDNSTYETGFEIERSANASNFTIVKTVDANVTAVDIDDNYQFGITYSFRMRAKTINNYSPYSTLQLSGLKPHIPVLTSPTNNAAEIGMLPVLTWGASTGANDYTLQVSTSSSFSSYIYSKSGLKTTSEQIEGLKPSTIYFWRVSASNNFGASNWSDIRSFTTLTPCQGVTSVTYDGKTYNTVAIGFQCWLKENLDVGSMIPVYQNSSNNGVIEKYCIEDKIEYCAPYGGLYQWNEAMAYSSLPGAQGICPDGWHIPTKGEFEILQSEVNNSRDALLAQGELSGNNSSGFSALLSGIRYDVGYYINLGYQTNYWTSNEYNIFYAYYMNLYYSNTFININYELKNFGYSVRCVKD
jgi:uncharacterized protein (TIGR02145 family)